MKLNALGRFAVNTPLRAAMQRRLVARVLMRLSGGLSGAKVLDVGCGRGIDIEIALSAFQAGTVDAFDIDPRMLQRARKRFGSDPRVRLWLGDALLIAAPDDAYDAALDFGTLYLVDDWRAGAAEIHRVLKPGGRLLFEVPACALTRLRDPLVTDRHRMAAVPFGREFVRELHACGFQVTSTRLRLAGTIQLAGDLIGVATKMGDDGPTRHLDQSRVALAGQLGAAGDRTPPSRSSATLSS